MRYVSAYSLRLMLFSTPLPVAWREASTEKFAVSSDASAALRS